MVDAGGHLLLHHGFRVIGHAQPCRLQHGQVVRAITNGKCCRQFQTMLCCNMLQYLQLGFFV